ncbi:MAG: hypothetical protein ABIQ53_10030 [Terracoccus sp.]
MTLVAARAAPVGPDVARAPFWAWWGVFSIATVAGTVLIGGSYRHAISGDPSYLAFWAGVLVFMLPVGAFVASALARRSGLLMVVAASGLFLYVPKILRNPFGPTYHDELAHWRQVADIAGSGHLFVSNTTIPIIRSFPGLHIVTLTMREISGLSTWSSALVLLAIVHVVDLLAVFLIIEGLTRSWRIGAIGAFLYSLNSSYMYFHTQFAYESLGVMLFLLAILAVQQADRAVARRARQGWGATAGIIGASCAVTHHLSTLFLCAVLVVWSAVLVIRRRRDRGVEPSTSTILAVTGFVIVFFGTWIALVAPDTVRYLEPYLGDAASQLTNMLGGAAGGRTPFSHNASPLLERAAGFASPLLVLFVAGLTVRYRRRHPDTAQPRSPSGFAALFAFGLLYFSSIPFLLAPSGAEGARRTWGFTYLGVAVIVAPTVARWLAQAGRAKPCAGHATRGLLVSAVMVVIVGNVAAGLDEAYRFPGPYTVGSDTGSQTPELAALSQWFPATVGPANKVVSDRFTGLSLGTFGSQLLDAPSAGFPTYQLWLDRGVPSPTLIEELSTSDYRYLVIDKQMALPVKELQDFFTGTAAASSDGTTTVTAADLERYANYGWLSRVYDSTNFAVYRFQFGSRGLSVGGS